MADSKEAPSQLGMSQQIQLFSSADGKTYQVGYFKLAAIMSVGPPII